jgi:hypothetical protein
MLLAVWVSLTYIGPGWAIGPLMALGLTTLTSFALAAFLLPLLGPHARLRDAKQAELARVRAAIRAARDRVLARDAGEVGGGRLGDLVAYEARVDAASEWPIATSTLLRFAFYLALGLAVVGRAGAALRRDRAPPGLRAGRAAERAYPAPPRRRFCHA